MGTIDLKHFIDYIIGYTNGLDLCHVGFSLGSTSSAIYALTYPEEAKKHIKVFIEMAPTLILDASRTPLIAVIPIKDWILVGKILFLKNSNNHLISLAESCQIFSDWIIYAFWLSWGLSYPLFLIFTGSGVFEWFYGISFWNDFRFRSCKKDTTPTTYVNALCFRNCYRYLSHCIPEAPLLKL